MLIETLRLVHHECEGYALKIDGKLKFEYFTQYDARADSILDRDHMDVLALGAILKQTYMDGVKTGGKGQATLTRRETESPEEYIDFVLRDE